MSYRDFEEFLESFHETGVRYLVVGAHAVAFHARPRATKDLDLLIDPSPDNVERVLQAIRRFFGGSDLGLCVEDLTDPDAVVQLGVAPVRIDLLCSLSGVAGFQAVWENRVEGRFGNVRASFLSLDDLIEEKRAAGRDQDKADVASLLKAKSRQ
jgi:hypothetical protein